ncbi:MAG: glycosyltransferase family 39 protein [Proteobacteria bacterium]|nr:glycosyltransferase family 39 protein [Pseudomonadota bacterium]
MASDSTSESRSAWLSPLGLLTMACIGVGVLARFWHLGKWPLAIDEYYFAQSVQNLLHFGFPKFACGGYYVRGLLLQYASAGLQLAGLSAELAPRLIAAVCTLVTLPAAYQIGRRLGGRDVALLAVAVLALSVWEVEIGRFGRMYAPFQAVFLWYVFFFLQYVIDGRRRALLPMLVLSAAGLAVWEGGIFLVVTNLLPPFIRHPDGRLSGRDIAYLVGCSLLLIPAYYLTMADLRTSDTDLPADYVDATDTPSQSRLDAAIPPFKTLKSHLGWAAAFLVPLGFVIWAAVRQVRTRLQPRAQPLAALGVVFVLGCAALQQFELAVGLLVIMVLLGVLTTESLSPATARPLYIAVLVCAVFWVVFGISTHDWHAPGLSPLQTLFLLGYEFVRFPDTARQVAMPWARTVPLLSLGLLILVGANILRGVLRYRNTSPVERILLALFVVLILAAAASNPPRQETRYVFFLYPLALLFSIVTFGRLMRALLGDSPLGARAAVAVCLVAFVLSEDFRPQHLWNIDSEAVNFRIGMGARLSSHYHPRSDTRAAATWLQAHAVPGEDRVIISYPGVDFYYPKSDYYFVADSDPRFESWACSRGTVQRWSNLPMIHSYAALQAKLTGARRVWMVLEPSRMQPILATLPPGHWTLEWTSREHDIVIVSVRAPH